MPYSALVTARKMPISLDGTVILWNGNSFSSVGTTLSAGDMAQLDGESPAKDANTAISVTNTTYYICMLFPELRDLSYLLLREGFTSANNGTMVVYSSTDTTNGADGTWTQVTLTGGSQVGSNTVGLVQTVATDWWRQYVPTALSGAVTGVKAVRISVSHSGGTQSLRGLHIFGKKTTGATPDDIIFLDTDLVTELGHDYDFGDVPAASANRDVTLAVKNASATHTANSIVLTSVGSNSSDYQISIDGGSTFASTQTITSLAAGAQQSIVVRLVPPAAASGNYTPRAANIQAAVTSWT